MSVLPGARRTRIGVAAGLVVVCGVALAVALVLWRGSDRTPVDHRFVIPAGTAARLEAGEEVEVLPARIELRSGDSVTLVNDDDVTQGSGFLVAPPHDSVTYEFNRAGTYVAACTLHPGGSLEIVVSS